MLETSTYINYVMLIHEIHVSELWIEMNFQYMILAY